MPLIELNTRLQKEVITTGVGLIFIVVGSVYVFKPDIVWYLVHGIHDKNSEPGGHTELLYRIGGVAAIIIGVLVAIGRL